MRQFTAAISGLSSGGLQGMLRGLRAAAASEIDASAPAKGSSLAATASRRRPRQPNVVTYRVPIDLQGARPPLWRRLELSSDPLLNGVHQVIQEAFGVAMRMHYNDSVFKAVQDSEWSASHIACRESTFRRKAR